MNIFEVLKAMGFYIGKKENNRIYVEDPTSQWYYYLIVDEHNNVIKVEE